MGSRRVIAATALAQLLAKTPTTTGGAGGRPVSNAAKPMILGNSNRRYRTLPGLEKGAGTTGTAGAGDATPPTRERRRMAQREFSSRRDSPVMVRLLEEIIAAQDK